MRRQQGNCRRASIWTSLVWRRTPSRISIPCYRPLAASSLCMHRINEVPIHISKHSFRLDSSECYVYPTCIYHTHILRHHEQIHFCFFSRLFAFHCSARKLTQWLNLLYQSQELIENFYTEWSYVAHSGFRDALKTIDRLSNYRFDLPIDLAVRQFQDIKDVF